VGEEGEDGDVWGLKVSGKVSPFEDKQEEGNDDWGEDWGNEGEEEEGGEGEGGTSLALETFAKLSLGKE
jgi:hypothetical protein